MLISRSNKFIYIRVPKTGSTSGLFYFLKSGLYDPKTDVYALDEPFYDWESMYSHFKRKGSDYLEGIKNFTPLPGVRINRCVHISFDGIVEQVPDIDNSYACYSVVREPIDRICSMYFYEMKRRLHDHKPAEHFNYADVNEFCYQACLPDAPEKLKWATRAQNSYFPEHAKLWNTENFHEHAVADITALGGKVPDKIHFRDNNIRPGNYKELLSQEVIEIMQSKYAKDYELWENAYAVYN